MNPSDLTASEENKGMDYTPLPKITLSGEEYDVIGSNGDEDCEYAHRIILFSELVDGFDLKLNIPDKIGYILNESGTVCVFEFTTNKGLFKYNTQADVKEPLEAEGKDTKLAKIIQNSVRAYFVENPRLLDRVTEEKDLFDGLILPVDERINPTYDKEVAEEFGEYLADTYDGDVLAFLEDILPNVILDDTNNVIKVFLACMSAILGLGSYLVEVLGDAGVGKSFLIDVVVEFLIPMGYVLHANNMTEASFKLLCKDVDDFFNRLIISFGDLGDPKQLQKLEEVFDIIKILITEGFFNSTKAELNSEQNWDVSNFTTIKVDSIGAIYSTVQGDNSSFNHQSDVRSQRGSRTVNCTPLTKDKIRMQRFADSKNIPGSKVNKDYEKATRILAKFREWLKYMIAKFDEEQKNRLAPLFRHLFAESTKFSSVQIRQMGQLTSMLQTITYLNNEYRGVNVTSENGNRYLFPYVEDVQKFINICNKAGLKEVDLDLLMKLKEETSETYSIPESEVKNHSLYGYADYRTEKVDGETITTFVRNDDGIDECIVQCALSACGHVPDQEERIRKSPNKEKELSDTFVMDELLNMYGITRENRKFNKSLDEDTTPALDQEQKKKPQVFFTTAEFRRVFQNHPSVKNIPNLNKALESYVEKGFLRKMTYTCNRGQNVYTTTPLVLDLQDKVEITEDDKIIACAVVLKDYFGISEEQLTPLCKAYGVEWCDVFDYFEKNEEHL